MSAYLINLILFNIKLKLKLSDKFNISNYQINKINLTSRLLTNFIINSIFILYPNKSTYKWHKRDY